MAKEQDLTAEQQLLQLIEGQDTKAAETGKGKHPKHVRPVVIERKAPLINADILKGKLSFLTDMMKGGIKLSDPDAVLALINNALVGFIGIMFVFLALEMMAKPKYASIVPQVTALRAQEGDAAAGLVVPRDFQYYSEKIKKRDAFRPKPKEVKVEEKAPAVEVSKINELIKDLRLAGLSPSEIPEERTAMIENTKTKSTSFVQEGGTIIGLKVDKITDTGVILRDGNETAELQ